jgi:hypothetical protein
MTVATEGASLPAPPVTVSVDAETWIAETAARAPDAPASDTAIASNTAFAVVHGLGRNRSSFSQTTVHLPLAPDASQRDQTPPGPLLGSSAPKLL